MGQARRRFPDQLAWWLPARFDPDGVRMGLRVLSRRPAMRWPSRRRLVLAASDADVDAGVAAVWMVIRSGRVLDEFLCLYEHDGNSWQCVGGGRAASDRGSISAPRPVAAVVRKGGSATRSYMDRASDPSRESRFAGAAWVACAIYYTPVSVAQLDISGRRITVPAHGHAVVVWKAPSSRMPPHHPQISALDGDGVSLAEFGPSDRFDIRTLIGLSESLTENSRKLSLLIIHTILTRYGLQLGGLRRPRQEIL